eukprot:1115614-Prymnesium_polylepis.1
MTAQLVDVGVARVVRPRPGCLRVAVTIVHPTPPLPPPATSRPPAAAAAAAAPPPPPPPPPPVC